MVMTSKSFKKGMLLTYLTPSCGKGFGPIYPFWESSMSVGTVWGKIGKVWR